MAWLCTMYILEQPVIQILHRMPIQTYNSYLIGLMVNLLCCLDNASHQTASRMPCVPVPSADAALLSRTTHSLCRSWLARHMCVCVCVCVCVSLLHVEAASGKKAKGQPATA